MTAVHSLIPSTSVNVSQNVTSNNVTSNSVNSDPSLVQTMEIDWNEVLKANQNWLRTVIAARIGEAAAVDEVWQEVSLAAFLQKSPIQDMNKVSAWLYRVAVTQSLMYRRKMGRFRKMLTQYADRVHPTEVDKREPSPLEWILSQERQEMLQKALSHISSQDKEILLLKYIHSWSYKEIAEKLGISVPAIQTRLHRARERLRQAVEYLQ